LYVGAHTQGLLGMRGSSLVSLTLFASSARSVRFRAHVAGRLRLASLRYTARARRPFTTSVHRCCGFKRSTTYCLRRRSFRVGGADSHLVWQRVCWCACLGCFASIWEDCYGTEGTAAGRFLGKPTSARICTACTHSWLRRHGSEQGCL